MKKLHDDMHDEIIDKTSKIHSIRSMMKKHKKAFNDDFLMLASECQTIIDLTKHKRVA